MSSIMEKSSSSSRPEKLEKRSFFLRSSSIQKIKCSATYPFRIAGSKLSREVIKQLIESVIIKARLFSQNALLILYIATLRFLGAIPSLSASLSINDDVCDKLKETEQKLTFIERVLARIIKLHAHKLEHQRHIREQEQKTEKKINVPAEINQINERLSKSSSNLAIEPVSFKRLLPNEKVATKKPNPMLVGIVYASAILIYIQLLALTIALNTAPTPPGLVFMIVSLSLIGYLAFKVFSQDRKRKSKRLRTARKGSQSDSSNTEQENKDSSDASRQSRIRIRRTFDFGGKTLSKIKMF